jgi:hypothetical protein
MVVVSVGAFLGGDAGQVQHLGIGQDSVVRYSRRPRWPSGLQLDLSACRTFSLRAGKNPKPDQLQKNRSLPGWSLSARGLADRLTRLR